MADKPVLPLGFAEQVLELQIKLEQEQSLQLIQILTQLYKIAVDYHIEVDQRKANYFQKKLNNLVVRSLNMNANKRTKSQFPKRLQKQIRHYQKCSQTYVKSMVATNEEKQKRIRRSIHKDLSEQEKKLQERIMLRGRSIGKF